MSAVNTRNVRNRRDLHFATLEEMEADVARIVAADRAGTLRSTGNWTAGQVFGHLASWANYAYDGYPPELRPPWFIKLLLKLRRKRFMRGPLPAGVKIPRIKGGTTAIEPLSTDEGLHRLTAATQRLRAAPPEQPNIVFGPLSHHEWQQLHLRHAELHLSFLHP